MDLAGPKLRTGPLRPGPCVVKVRPTRDVFGRVTQPARIWFSSQETPRKPPTHADASLELPEVFLKTLMVGDRLASTDARGASMRAVDLVAVGVDGSWAESTRTCYFTSDVRVRAQRAGVDIGVEALVSDISPVDAVMPLVIGDLLILTRELTPGRAAARDSVGRVLNPATVGCTSSQVFEDARAGERVWIDDGRIGGIIERKELDRLHIRITNTRVRGAKLAADKGINLPDSALRLAAMTDKDRADLAFVAVHADMVALSFANTVDDVRALRTLLAPLGDRQPAVVLKIETKRGFENLPAMLLEAMEAPRCGVMIARGDLAVECGFERLAEVQEEILWICEAAHVPRHLGDAGPRDSRQGRPALASGDYRCRHVAPRGVRHAQQGTVRHAGGSRSRRYPPPHAWSSNEEASDAARASARVGVSACEKGQLSAHHHDIDTRARSSRFTQTMRLVR